MNRPLLLILLLCVSLGVLGSGGDPQLPAAAQINYKGGLRFIENKGQWDGPGLFRANLQGGHLWFEGNRLTYDFCDVTDLHDKTLHGEKSREDMDFTLNCHAFRVSFPGALAEPEMQAGDLAPEYHNYFIGKDPAKWAPHVNLYRELGYQNLYPGINLQFHAQETTLKYDFIVAPGADASRIRMLYEGVDALNLQGEMLEIVTTVNRILEQAPYAYQDIGGERITVPCRFEIAGEEVHFIFPEDYDHSHTLVIDPTLIFSTYTGSTSDNFGFTATYDTAGNLYAGGIAFGLGYPTTPGAYQVAFVGGAGGPFFNPYDMSITCFNPTGTALKYSTFLGGTGYEQPMSLIATEAGELCVYGRTSAADFPITAGAYQTVMAGVADITVTKFNPLGTALIGSTYIGGGGNDGLNVTTVFSPTSLYHNYGDDSRGEIMLDASDNIYIASCTQSINFPTTGGAYQSANGGAQDGVVCKFNPTLTSLVYSTYIGGSNNDAAYSVKVPSSGNAYVCGGTESSNFPSTAGSFNPLYVGAIDGFALQLNATGTALLASTFLGTPSYDQAHFLEIDASDNVYLYGQTEGPFTVTPGVYSEANGKQFIMQLDPTLSTLNFSTVFGTGGFTIDIAPTAFLVDVCGFIYVAGWGGGVNYAGTTTGLSVTPDAFQPTTDGSDLYLAVFNPGATALKYASFYGGPISQEHVDGGTSRFDKQLRVYHSVCAGCGGNSDLPIYPPGTAWSATNNSTNCNLGAFKLQFDATGLVSSFASFAIDSCAPYPVIFTNLSTGGGTIDSVIWNFGDGTIISDTSTTINYVYTDPGSYLVTLIVIDSNSCNIVDSVSHLINVYPNPIVTTSGDVTTCAGTEVHLSASGGDFYEWSPGAGMMPSSSVSNPTVEATVTTTYSVIVTSDKGCVDTGYVNVTVTNFFCDAGPPAFFCEGSGGAQLMAGPIVGGVPGYYYEWWCDSSATYCALDSVFDNDPIANPDVTTMYYLQVTDTTGCKSYVDSVLVTILPNPIVDAGPDQWICPFPAPGANLNATVSGAPGPYVYSWDPPTGLSSTIIPNPYARPDTTTIYVLTVVSSNGCTSIPTTVDTLSSVTVHVFPQPIADAGPDRDLCEGDTLMLLGLGYGAGPTYTYEWSPFTPPTTISANNIPNPLAFPDITTDYTLVVWSNGCPSIADTVTVNAHTNPTADAGPDRDICRFDSVLIDAQAGGDSSSTFYLFEWSPAAGLSDAFAEDPMASPDTTNLYYVIGISSWGCESPRDSVLVTVKPTPIPDAGPPIQICYGDSVLIPTSIYYDGTPPAPASAIWPAWVPAVQINDTTLLQPTVWPTSSGFYYVTLQYNTCFTTDSVLLTVIPSPVANVSADTTILCEGQSTQLSATGGLGGADFLWSPATGLSDPNIWNPVATPDTTTTYTVTAAEGGCDGVNTITIQVIPLPEMGYFSSQPTGCAPLTVSFLEDVKDALFYSWNFGDGTVSNEPAPVHTFMLPGDYTVTLTASNLGACESSISTITVHVSDPSTAEFTADPGFPVQLALPDTRVQFTDRSTYAVSWLWDFGDGQSSYDQHPAHSWTQPGEYTVTLTTQNEDGCISVVEHGPFVVKTPEVFIPNVFSPGDGVNDVFIVQYTGDQPFSMVVLDRWGKRLYESRNKTEGWDGRDVKGTPVPVGVYYYTVKIGDREFAGEVTLLR